MSDNNSPKLKRQILYRIFTAAIAVITLTAATIAWFASNDRVGGSGMAVDADTVSNLVIAKDKDTLKKMTVGDATYTIDFNPRSSELVPARHDPALAAKKSAYPDTASYLQYDASPEAVDKDTGIKIDSSFGIVPVGGTQYYTDYVVYIAATPKEMPVSSLKIKLSWTPKNDTERAFSIDVFRGGTLWSKDYYINTLNINKKSFTVASDTVIPRNSDGGYIRLILRCYFDGGLVKGDTGNTYINSATVSPTEIKAKLTFTASE